MKSILENYIYLFELWDEAYEETKDTDTKARMMGVAVQMKSCLVLLCSSFTVTSYRQLKLYFAAFLLLQDNK